MEYIECLGLSEYYRLSKYRLNISFHRTSLQNCPFSRCSHVVNQKASKRIVKQNVALTDRIQGIALQTKE